jgi:hypothetical protein
MNAVEHAEYVHHDHDCAAAGCATLGWLPFLPEFGEAIRSGRKTATARTKRYGESGDRLRTPFGTILLRSVERMTLEDIARNLYREEGCRDPLDFERVWKSIHRRKDYDPNQWVWLHRFEFISSRKDSSP